MSDTDSSFDNVEPFRPPNPVVVAQWAGVARHILTFGGAALATFGISTPTWLANLTDPQLSVIVSLALVAVGMGMSGWASLQSWRQKATAREAQVAGAVASAQNGIPVTVEVIKMPVGQPDIAKPAMISLVEQAKAPVVPRDVAPTLAPRSAA